MAESALGAVWAGIVVSLLAFFAVFGVLGLIWWRLREGYRETMARVQREREAAEIAESSMMADENGV